MEIKTKDKLLLKGRFGAIKKIEAMYQMISKKLYIKGSDLSDLESIPCEITQQCRSDALAFERRQAQAMADAQRMRNRMI